MKNNIRIIKKKLDDSISKFCEVAWMFSSNPEKDFSRDRKLPLKKVEYMYEEIYAKLIMYNFTELITSQVIVHKLNTKYVYKVNFTVAVHLCRQLFLGNISPPDLEALIRKNVSPVRPGRSRPRNLTTKYAVSFLYRVA